MSRRDVLEAAVLLCGGVLPSTAKAAMEVPMGHVVLLGDSIFDNAAYVSGGPDVVRQLRGRLPQGWRATLNAVDGSVIAGVERQLRQLPPDASHLVLSVGGNDALREAGVLEEKAGSVAEALEKLSDIGDEFERQYEVMLTEVRRFNLPTAVCTIYDARFPDPRRRRLAATALTLLNDRITRSAFARDLPVIDLRL